MTGNLLKLIAVVTMLLDHIGAAVVGRMLTRAGSLGMTGDEIAAWGTDTNQLYTVYIVLRVIGRIAFPIFCYFVVEGYVHTRDVRKYALRLGAFALISEVPFDLAVNGELLETGSQNIYFTLFIGLAAIRLVDMILQREWKPGCPGMTRVIRIGLAVCVCAGSMALAEALHTDYGWGGVAVILILYLFRQNKRKQLVSGYLAFILLFGGMELAALPAFVLLAFYNGRRGAQIKYFFYAFYPVHLLLLYLLCILLGIAAYTC